MAAGDAGDDGATPASMSDNEAPALRTIDRSCNQQRRPATLPIDMEPHRHSQAKQLATAIPKQAVEDLMQRGDLSLEIASIRRQLARLASGHGAHGQPWSSDLPTPGKSGNYLSEIIAECDEVIGRAGQRVAEERRHELLARYLAQHLRCGPGIDWDQNRMLIVAGPTGVGKTTTIAKMAGELVLRRGGKVGLITVDTYRVGAADQLQAYADLLDVPFAVARTPAELAQAVERMRDCDNILVDTAGRSPSDAARVHELKGFCRAVPGLGVALTVSATAGRAEFAAVMERFSLLPIEFCLLTKLDECKSPRSSLRLPAPPCPVSRLLHRWPRGPPTTSNPPAPWNCAKKFIAPVGIDHALAAS